MENLTDNFLNINVNDNVFGDLKFEYYWALPIGVLGYENVFEKFVKPAAPSPLLHTYCTHPNVGIGFDLQRFLYS